jgi:iron-sulfur cluster repair protein YtfE (RIC family)
VFAPNASGYDGGQHSRGEVIVPNVITLLKQDHRTVEKMFSDFEESQDASIVDQICAELETHMELEERLVYPVLRADVPEGDGMASHAEDEHKEARQVIGRIRNTKDPEHLTEVTQELKSAIQEHVSEEENEVFPKMEQSLDAERLEQMGSELEAQRG